MTHSPTRHETGTNEPGRLNHCGNAYGQLAESKTPRRLIVASLWLCAAVVAVVLALGFQKIMDEGHRVAAERVQL